MLCLVEEVYSEVLEKNATQCFANQKIESEDYFVQEERRDLKIFVMDANKYVKFVPKNISENFPDLQEFEISSCGLTVVRSFYFENMKNLRFLILHHNKIATIEANAFKDLVGVERLWLHNNFIETLDENLFNSMLNLQEIYLNVNKIKLLSPETFKNVGSLDYVDLRKNPCAAKEYYSLWCDDNLNKFKSDLKSQCTRSIFAKILDYL